MASLKWKAFDGLNNKVRPEAMGHGELSIARNVDIDNRKRLTRRNGYASIATLTWNYHSLWAKDGLICLAVKAGNLVRINEDWSETTVRANVGDSSMSYVEVNKIVYYTNGMVIGYIAEGSDHQFTNPSKEFKRAPFPGQLIEYFNGRLWIARDNVLWFTDALAFDRVDMRQGFKQLPSTITMVKAVEGGIYVSDTNDTYWLNGGSPTVMAIKKVEGAALPGSGIVVNGQSLGKDFQGSHLIFTTDNGICLGNSGGQVINLTNEKYRLPITKKAAVMVRDEGNKLQYVARLYN